MLSDDHRNAGTPPPQELIEALAAALAREHDERDAEKRARILAGARAALDAWRRGRMTTAQAVLLVRVSSGG